MNRFNENFHGILTHNGWVKVAKFSIIGSIKNISNNDEIFVKTRTGKVHCDIHKDLKDDLKFMDIGDSVGVKWNCGKAYVVGYRKKNFDEFMGNNTGDLPVSENSNWVNWSDDR